MIVGSGMIAMASKAADAPDTLIFASGVSDSKEEDPKAYQREVDLFNQHAAERDWMRIFYFSTCSVYDPENVSSPYVSFKLEREREIIEEYPASIILRLPQVIGSSENPKQLGAFLFDRLSKEKSFEIYENACRYLFYAGDLPKVIELFNRKEFCGSTINVAHKNRCSIKEIVEIFEQLMGVTANYKLVPKGSCYEVPNSDFVDELDRNKLELRSTPTEIISEFLSRYSKRS